MSTCQCHRTREGLSTYIFDSINLKVLSLLNCEPSKYIAKIFSLSITQDTMQTALVSLSEMNMYAAVVK